MTLEQLISPRNKQTKVKKDPDNFLFLFYSLRCGSNV